MGKDEKTLSQWAMSDGIPVRKAQRHRAILGVGRLFGTAWVLNDKQWEQIKKQIANTRPGNPNFRKKNGRDER